GRAAAPHHRLRSAGVRSHPRLSRVRLCRRVARLPHDGHRAAARLSGSGELPLVTFLSRNRLILPRSEPHLPTMDSNQIGINDALYQRIQDDLVDGFDEELELEVDDRVLEARAPAARSGDGETKLERHRYFRELFGLQRELVKMQDWVSEAKHRLVV